LAFSNELRKPARVAPWNLRDMVCAGLAALGLAILGVGTFTGGMWLWGLLGLPELPERVQVLAIFSLEAFLLVPAWWWGPRKYGGGWWSLGLRGFPPIKAAGLVISGFLCILLINGVWEILRERLGLAAQPDYLPLFGGGLKGLAVALVAGGVVAPVAEEIFFRGYLYAGLRREWGAPWAMAASALIFALVHVIPGVVPPVFVMGVLFAFISEQTGSVWPCVALHSAVNSLAFIAAYLAESFAAISPGA
jgi:membrane protease YdiL (CAAX protease family)